MEGWIKIHRKLLEWEWHDDPNVLSVWIHLLLLANHDERRWRNTTVNRGQLITTIEGISEATGISVQSVRTALKKLENTCEISQKSTNKFRIITICKYDNYQFSDNTEQQTTNKQLTNNQQTTNKQLTTNKNIENIITRENNNTPHTSAYAHTHEVDEEDSGIVVLPIESLYNEYRAEIENGTKADQFALYYKNNFNYDLTSEQILSHLKSFQAWLGQQGITHKTMIDYRKHFSLWMQREIKERIKQQQYGKPNTDRRPGTMSDILQVAQPTPGIESNF